MKLWVDDLRDPPDPEWMVARNYQEAIAILELGLVVTVSFDHDLGEEKDGHDILTWLEEQIYYDKIQPPIMTVHSANPVGRKQMELAIKRIYEREGILEQKSESGC